MFQHCSITPFVVRDIHFSPLIQNGLVALYMLQLDYVRRKHGGFSTHASVMCDFDVLLVAIRLRLNPGNRQTNLCQFFALRCSIYTQLNCLNFLIFAFGNIASAKVRCVINAADNQPRRSEPFVFNNTASTSPELTNRRKWFTRIRVIRSTLLSLSWFPSPLR